MTLTDDETVPGTITLTTDPTSVGEDASETEVTVIATLGGSVTLSRRYRGGGDGGRRQRHVGH